ncbi:ATP-binding protein [Salinicola sp. CR57]|uniref:ATP-dependent nuclease n=1 Tax=Salinicola sp. CR57 TaxID=1949086 RepID=UPI000DA1C5AF|nr:ATP-binding protein [Salinicola sp. CR57]
MKDRFTSVVFKNYKALKSYSVSLNEFNVLVGPNNAGKSTIVGAFRILSEGMRKAAARKPQYIDIEGIDTFGYFIPLEGLPVATENIFTNYDESKPATVEFRLSTGNKLKLVFPENNVCWLLTIPKGKPVQSPSDFRRVYNASVGFVPVLGPVEHNEQLYQKEAARLALLSHRASRNFRNIWYHYPDEFDNFRELIGTTWPSMDIERPEVDTTHKSPVLHMFCPEERYPREIFWAGFGFQVWCQMLTYIVRSREDSLLIIDEPDIYLHSDLQRQLVEILRQSETDVLIATHSTEIISETDPGDLLVINKRNRSARRIKDPTQLQSIFGALGSNLNPTLTQLAKSRRAVFVEGKDFQILSSISRKLDRQAIANRSDFAVIPVEGFNPAKVRSFSEGIEATLGTKILKCVIFDRDYRADDEVKKEKKDFDKFCEFFHIHERKEIENYLLVPSVLEKTIQKRVKDRSTRTNKKITFNEDVEQLLAELTQQHKSHVMGQFLTKRSASLKAAEPSLDTATINQRLLDEFEETWSELQNRLKIVPGKKLLAKLNEYLQDKYDVTLSHSAILASMNASDIPGELASLIDQLELFRNSDP